MLLQKIFLLLIRLYQKTFSPDHGVARFFLRRGTCIYRPTCSEYASDAIKHFGIIKGAYLGIKRLSKCHPWHEPGYDPLKITKIQTLCHCEGAYSRPKQSYNRDEAY